MRIEIATWGLGPQPWREIQSQKWFTMAEEVLGSVVNMVPSFENGIASENRKKQVHQQRIKTNKIAAYFRKDRRKVM